MAKSGIGISVTDVDTEAKMPLGYIYVEPEASTGSRANQGPREWVYVYNDEAANAFKQGNVVARDAATATCDGVLTTTAVAAHRVLGVAQHEIPAGSYGFILKRGIGVVEADGSVTANSPITSNASGQVTDMVASAEHCVIGLALEADTSAGDLVDAWVNCLGC